MIIGKVTPGHRVRFLGRELLVTAEGDFVAGIGRDAKKTQVFEEISPAGNKHIHRFDVQQRQYREQRINGVPNKTVNVPESALPRIRQETTLTKAARAVETRRQDFLTRFQWPTKGIISGVYGSRRVYNGQPRRPHYGVDIAADQGAKVVAPAGGSVTLVHKDMYFSGGTLIVDHGHGISSTFIHLHKIWVKEGDELVQGQLMAEVGASGRATGPHLDWRMNWFEQRLDPQLLMDSLPDKAGL